MGKELTGRCATAAAAAADRRPVTVHETSARVEQPAPAGVPGAAVAAVVVRIVDHGPLLALSSASVLRASPPGVARGGLGPAVVRRDDTAVTAADRPGRERVVAAGRRARIAPLARGGCGR